MNAWKRIALIYISTCLLGAFTYASAVVIIEGGKELGEPMWEGFFIQLFLLSTYGLVLGALLFLPILILVEKFVANYNKKIASYAVATLFFLTGAFTLYAGVQPLTSLLLSIIPTLLVSIILYLTMRSSSCFARDRASRAAP